jgi:hypothetical protein
VSGEGQWRVGSVHLIGFRTVEDSGKLKGALIKISF